MKLPNLIALAILALTVVVLSGCEGVSITRAPDGLWDVRARVKVDELKAETIEADRPWGDK